MSNGKFMNPLNSNNAWDLLHRGNSARMDEFNPARFNVGEEVVARNLNPFGHIRLPRYVRGRKGVIAKDQGEFIFPDSNAEGIRKAERLYSVRFEAKELWNNGSGDTVYVDLFESYLEGV